MVRIQSEIKRALLRSLWSCAKKTQGAKLRSALESYQNSQFSSLKSGRIIVNNSANGHSTSIEVAPQWRQLSQESVLALSELFINVYDDSVVVAAQNSISNPSEDQLLAIMMADDRLQGVTSESLDITGLRYGYQ
jgi:archaellum biogenesis protein FlaJ (TadC family)